MVHLTLKNLGLLSLLLTFTLNVNASEYWTGGIGLESRQEAPQKNTRFEFFDQSRAYIADIDFTITNSTGDTLVEGLATGPWLILELPDGLYTFTGIQRETKEQRRHPFSARQGQPQTHRIQY
ncbi:hypothetical protein DN062_14410 [Nitrincola tibetensis]|uniref:Uncharacterized protein n=1 Tax=Nitrincola tibetensis TaxID=2219697 RepID=A0A364NJ82_9GAMM|nr:hypothetical protein [Nitrincola tibetensis]RAU17104.1 hypothetical protein DN062_14410 [Nitrincola tibetensis]